MAKKLPFYPLYVDDFDEDEHVLPMNLAEVGLYQLALNEAWKRGFIPDDPRALARVIRRDAKQVNKAWPRVRARFIETEAPGKLVNPRMEKERIKANEKAEKASEAAGHRQNLKIPGSIYLISRSSDGAVKIGSSANVAVRLAQLKYRYRKDQLELVTSVHVENMGDTELSLHEMFAARKLNGEWYLLSPDDIITLRITLEGDNHCDTLGDTTNHPVGVEHLRASESKSSLSSSSTVQSSKEPTTPDVSPVRFGKVGWRADTSYAALVKAYEGIKAEFVKDEDFAVGYLDWNSLDWEQKLAAVDHVKISDPAHIKLPQNFIRFREWTRKPRPAPKSKTDRLMDIPL